MQPKFQLSGVRSLGLSDIDVTPESVGVTSPSLTDIDVTLKIVGVRSHSLADIDVTPEIVGVRSLSLADIDVAPKFVGVTSSSLAYIQRGAQKVLNSISPPPHVLIPRTNNRQFKFPPKFHGDAFSMGSFYVKLPSKWFLFSLA